jgi:phosphopantothenoylcysteine decarboxylase / phosphopantothenate---cysteine ligase
MAMKVVLGVSGGIAAYKAAELVRELQQKGVEVQVVMTANAQEFVRPLTFAALTGKKVITRMFGSDDQEANVESAIEHIAVAQSIDLLVVAPATADCIAKFANGIADDFLTTLYLATKAPVVLAPAMNVNMWNHPATRENIARLRDRGVVIVDPDAGYLACGMTGPGRLASNDAIVARALETLGMKQDLQGDVVLVTAGPTREPLDPVRYLSNRSSGKMGYAIAEAAQRRGARTVLVSGPTALTPPEGVEFVPVVTVAEMRDAVLRYWPQATVAIKAAAVADFRPRRRSTQKIKKFGAELTLELEPTEDILAEIGGNKGSRIVVGFAAETEEAVGHARGKLQSKNLDMIVANDVSDTEIGFDSDYNTVTILGRDGGERHLPKLRKTDVAQEILNEVVRLRSHGKH